jgi:MFS family permease
MLRAPGAAALLATFGWGLMNIGFPLYATRLLHAGAHISGYMWAAVGAGSSIGTFVLAGPSTLRRIGFSYASLGASALLWPFVHTAALGIALIGLTGFLEGPAYSGTLSLRQRHAPPAVAAQVVTTLGAANQVAVSAGAALAGALGSAPAAIGGFIAINLLAALAAWRG